MSGLDEQHRKIPECPKCEMSREYRIAQHSFAFSEKSRIRRNLKYPFFFRGVPNLSKEVICISCQARFGRTSDVYKEIKRVYKKHLLLERYYTNQEDFSRDDEDWH